MWRLGGIALVLVSVAGATPVAFTGTSNIGGDLYDLFLNGTSSGFKFGTAAPGWSLTYSHCDWDTGTCDLSDTFHVYPDFSASNGTISTGKYGYFGPNGGPPGMAEGVVMWAASPLTSPPGGPLPATVVLPIVVFGHLRAWTPEELAAHSAPFFDYQITATGTLTAVFQNTVGNVDFVIAEFTGTATPIPEPATWLPISVLGVVWLWRRKRAAAVQGVKSCPTG